jgi:hypothetical protein
MRCTGCGTEDAEFYLTGGRPQQPCKECRKAISLAAWHSMTPEQAAKRAEAHWEQSLQRKFNITPAQYWLLFEQQDGRCRICRRSIEEIGSERFKHLSVDHDRNCCPGDTSCGQCIRGLLCAKCNGSLGWYEQFPAEIAAYLLGARIVLF